MLEVEPLRSLGQSRFCVSSALWKEGYGYGGGAVLATGFADGVIRLFGLGPGTLSLSLLLSLLLSLSLSHSSVQTVLCRTPLKRGNP